MKKLKLISVFLISVSVMGLNPIGASAAWKQDNSGWWYTENNSWATGWRNIDGKWYYFNSRGYMEHDTTIDDYYLDSTGAWSTQTLDEQGRYKEGTIISLSGTLKKVDWIHPGNGSHLSYYVLKLDTPANFNLLVNGEKSINDGINEIQVIGNYNNSFSNEDALESKVNQHVTLKGKIWGGAGTWYYHKPATLTWLEDK